MNTWVVDPGEEFLTQNRTWLMQEQMTAERCQVPLMEIHQCVLVAGHSCPHAVWLNKEPPEHLR